MPRKKRDAKQFGERLRAIRKAKGMTQVQLAKAIRSTQRAISHYETEPAYPPAPVVADIAKALKVTTDELLGVTRTKVDKDLLEDAEVRRLWKKFLMLRRLPEKDQRAVVRMINSLSKTNGQGGS